MNSPSCELSRALPASYYTDSTVFERACSDIFMHTWQPAGHVSQLSQVGDCLTLTIVGQDLFVLRGKDGQLRAFYNVCQHRGHRLIPGEGRIGRMERLVCPYHAWRYDFDGTLLGAPHSNKVPGFDCAHIRLSEIRLEVMSGLVFVNFDDKAPTLAESYPGVAEAIDGLCPDVAERQVLIEYDFDEECNWLVAVENYNECYHCRNVHKDLVKGVFDPDNHDIKIMGPGRCIRHYALPAKGEDAWYETSGEYGVFFLWPSTGLQFYPGGLVNSYSWRPLAVDKSRIRRSWFSDRDGDDDKVRRVAKIDRKTTFQEDLDIIRNVQRGLNSKGYRPGPLVLDPAEGINSEHSIAALHDWFLNSLGEKPVASAA